MRKSILFILLSFTLYSYGAGNNTDYFKTAVKYENTNNNEKAIFYYLKFLETSKDVTQTEKVRLKIARLSAAISDSDAVKEYKFFLENYPASRFRFLARFELASLYRLYSDSVSSLREYYKLAEISYGTPYWQKSLLQASLIELNDENYKSAIVNLYRILEEIDDYEDIGRSYFYLGVALSKQKKHEDAEEFFLICAGSFPQCSKAPGALLELLNIHIIKNEINHAVKTAQMIDQLYTDSPENNEAKKKVKDLTAAGELPEIELINLNENQEIKQKAMSRLTEDLYMSVEIIKEDRKAMNLNSGFYIQFGYYSNRENADEMVLRCADKEIKNVIIAKVMSAASKNYFYRVLSGPYDSGKSANEKLIEIKEKNIEAIVLELTKDYE